jgi:hypothetical protein
MKSCDGDAGVVVEPYNNPGPRRIDTSVIGTCHGIAFTAACNNREGLERSRFKMMSNIADHAFECSAAMLTSAMDNSSSPVPLLQVAMMCRPNAKRERYAAKTRKRRQQIHRVSSALPQAPNAHREQRVQSALMWHAA